MQMKWGFALAGNCLKYTGLEKNVVGREVPAFKKTKE